MGVASCRIILLLFDFVLNRVCCLVPFCILFRELDSDLWLCVPRDFDPRCSLALARVPLPLPHARTPLSPGLFPSFNSPKQQPPLLHLSLPVVP
jgi:hypothetical protein